jgi:hypothetical protein
VKKEIFTDFGGNVLGISHLKCRGILEDSKRSVRKIVYVVLM